VAVLETGKFSMLVPDGWHVTGTPDEFYELTRPPDDGALHISVYERNGSATSKEEALQLVKVFLDRLKPTESTSVMVLAESDEQHRAVCRCVAANPDRGDLFDWLVFLVLWKPAFLMCSCTAPRGSSMVSDAEQMFATIFPPEKPKRGLFGRR
jgi:hypothetical protein